MNEGGLEGKIISDSLIGMFSLGAGDSCVGGCAKSFSRPLGLNRSHFSPYATSPCSSLRFHSGTSCDWEFFLGEELDDFFFWIVSHGAELVVEAERVRESFLPRAFDGLMLLLL